MTICLFLCLPTSSLLPFYIIMPCSSFFIFYFNASFSSSNIRFIIYFFYVIFLYKSYLHLRSVLLSSHSLLLFLDFSLTFSLFRRYISLTIVCVFCLLLLLLFYYSWKLSVDCEFLFIFLTNEWNEDLMGQLFSILLLIRKSEFFNNILSHSIGFWVWLKLNFIIPSFILYLLLSLNGSKKFSKQ